MHRLSLHFIGCRQDNPITLFLSRTPFAIVYVISPLISVVGAVTFQQAHTESTSTQLLQNFLQIFSQNHSRICNTNQYFTNSRGMISLSTLTGSHCTFSQEISFPIHKLFDFIQIHLGAFQLQYPICIDQIQTGI